MEGTSSRIAGRPRPAYPSAITLFHSVWRILIVCVASFVLHHFITNTLITPGIYALVKSYCIQTYIANSFVVRFLIEKTFVGTRLELNNHTVDDALMFIIGTLTIHFAVYVVVNSFFALCDHFAFLQHYRIPVEKRGIPSKELIRATLIDALATLLFSGPITLLMLSLFPARYWRNLDSPAAMSNWDAPFYVQIAYFVGALVFNEVAFYFVHRAAHEVPGVYKRVHFLHHKWIGAQSISAEYAHPAEALLANFLPTALFMAVMSRRGIPVSAWYTWVFVRLIETFEAHSGFDFRTTFLYDIGLLHGSCMWHYQHHVQNRGNYGSYMMDWVGGTMDGFLTDERRLKCPAEIDAEKLLTKE